MNVTIVRGVNLIRQLDQKGMPFITHVMKFVIIGLRKAKTWQICNKKYI